MALHEQLEELFREIFNDDALVLSDETTAADIAGWDSVAHINLMCSIEQRFAVQFTGNELAEMNNIGELKKFLSQKGKQ
jgi:acyl carrier protein